MRKVKPQLQRINIDELFDNSSNRGMLSFLERPPEEATAGLLEKQRVNDANSQRFAPAGDLLPFVTNPEGNSPVAMIHPLFVKSETGVIEEDGAAILTGTESILPRGCFTNSSVSMDGSIIGRRQKIRRALVAQDGHSSGEHLLYQSLWNAATVETPETRVISVGYNGMSALCKLDKSNCKKNIQSLLQKLSVQVAATYQSTSSTGTTYRIFSDREILRRREAAGMVWIIRTSGVRFVYPEDELRSPQS